MKPYLNLKEDGKISIGKETLNSDFYINAIGEIISRAELLKSDLGTPKNILSLAEAAQCQDPTVHQFVIGCDDQNKLVISEEAYDFFDEHQLKIKLLPVREAADYWNRYEGKAIGLFHLSSE